MGLSPWKVLPAEGENDVFLMLVQFQDGKWTLSIRDDARECHWSRDFSETHIQEEGGSESEVLETEEVLSCLFNGSAGQHCLALHGVGLLIDESGCTVTMLMVSNQHFQLKVNAVSTYPYAPRAPFADVWHMTSLEAAFPGRVLLWDTTTLSPAFHGQGVIGLDATPTRDGAIFCSTGDFAVTFQATDYVNVDLEDANNESQVLRPVAEVLYDAIAARRWVVRVTVSRSCLRVRCKDGVALRGCGLSVRRLQ